MERETVVTGYCRQLDQSRMVTVEADGCCLIETDCLFDNCPYRTNCAVSQKIREFLDAGTQ